jgi:hypothetical protein
MAAFTLRKFETAARRAWLKSAPSSMPTTSERPNAGTAQAEERLRAITELQVK